MVDPAFTYALRNGKNARYLIGVICIYFSWLVFPAVFLLGYFIQILTFTSLGNRMLPPVDSVLKTAKLGVIGMIIAFSYATFVIAAPMTSAAFIATEFFITPTNSFSSLFKGFMILLIVFTALYLLVLPVVLCVYGRTGEFQAVYDVNLLYRLFTSREIITAMLSIVTLTTIALVLTGILVLVTIGIGAIAIPFVLFWYALAAAYFYGDAVGTVTGTIEATNLSP